MRTLLFQQCHLVRPEQGRLMAVSQALLRRLNPGMDLLLVDNASPEEPLGFVDPPEYLHRFTDAIGHPALDDPVRADGPGRALCKGIELAIEWGYDRLVYHESDALFSRPVSWGFDQMTKPSAMQPMTPFGFHDFQVWWLDLHFARDFDFVAKYNWQGPVHPFMETRIPRLLGNNIEVLPTLGERGEWTLTPEVFMRKYGKTGCDFITHVQPETFAAFLELNGHGDLVSQL